MNISDALINMPDEDICTVTNLPHEPDWNSVHVESDGGEYYVDVNCKHCGRSGCIGTSKILKEEIDW